jgi:hypothetical protein
MSLLISVIIFVLLAAMVGMPGWLLWAFGRSGRNAASEFIAKSSRERDIRCPTGRGLGLALRWRRWSAFKGCGLWQQAFGA